MPRVYGRQLRPIGLDGILERLPQHPDWRVVTAEQRPPRLRAAADTLTYGLAALEVQCFQHRRELGELIRFISDVPFGDELRSTGEPRPARVRRVAPQNLGDGPRSKASVRRGDHAID